MGATPVEVPLDPALFSGARVDAAEYKGRPALRLIGDAEEAAFIKGLELGDCIIDVDIATESVAGIAFRASDGIGYDLVRVDPNVSGTERHNQTVSYRSFGARGEVGVVSAGAGATAGEWFTLRLVIRGKRLEVFVSDQPNAALVVDPIASALERGAIGVWGAGAYFSHLQYTRLD